MILVTGAAGKTGDAVARALIARGQSVRALVRPEQSASDLERLGVAEVVAADLLSPPAMARALAGVRALYLIAPNTHPEETRIGEIALSTAQTAGIELVVYHSVLHPQTRQMPHHWQKLAVEEMLFASGLNFTILQPAAYMQNVLASWDEIRDNGRYRVPYGDGAALSLVDLDDVAEVAASVLTESRHQGASFELAGPEALTPVDIAEILSDILPRPVSAEIQPLEDWAGRARAGGLRRYRLEALVRMFRYYDRHGLRGNPQALHWLLGREPTTFGEFVERTIAASDTR